MLVTFRTKAHANITMFGDVAVRLMKLMGHTGTVPSALRAEDVPAAAERLKNAVSKIPDEGDDDDDGDGERHVSLRHRALPLIELLEAAGRKEENVMWDEGV